MSKFKKLVTSIPLSAFAGLAIGAISVLAVEFLFFKRHITAAGSSACITSIGLLFAIYSAFKVKEWSVIKMDEKAFKQTESIYECIYGLQISISIINSKVMDFADSNKENYKDQQLIGKLQAKWSETYEKEHDNFAKLLAYIASLPAWKYRMHPDAYKIIGSIGKQIDEIDSAFTELNQIHSIDNYQTTEGRKLSLIEGKAVEIYNGKISIIKIKILEVQKNLSIVTRREFNEIFIKIITSPSKKVN